LISIVGVKYFALVPARFVALNANQFLLFVETKVLPEEAFGLGRLFYRHPDHAGDRYGRRAINKITACNDPTFD
jgi:hypothetical protein